MTAGVDHSGFRHVPLTPRADCTEAGSARIEVYVERIPGLPPFVFVERFEGGPEPTDIIDLTVAEARRLHAELGELLGVTDAPTNGAVEAAVSALRCFGDDLDRLDAAELLSMWARRGELSNRDRLAVLDAFGPPPQPVRPVPYAAQRWAEPGEVCSCGAAAVVVYEGDGRAAEGFCGVNRA